jgi:hypothetical protein
MTQKKQETESKQNKENKQYTSNYLSKHCKFRHFH